MAAIRQFFSVLFGSFNKRLDCVFTVIVKNKGELTEAVVRPSCRLCALVRILRGIAARQLTNADLPADLHNTPSVTAM